MLNWLRLALIAICLAGGASSGLAVTAAENRAFKEARSAFEDKIWERAERQFGMFLEKFPGSTLATEAILFRAQALFKLERFSEAIPLLEERKAAAGPQTDRYLYLIGEARFQSRDFPAAAQAFAELLATFPQSDYRLEAAVSEAEARARLGDWPGVSKSLSDPGGVFQRAATNTPGIPWVIRGKLIAAQANLERGDETAALEAIQSLGGAVLTPEQTWQRQQLRARIELSAGRLEQAEAQSTNLVLLAAFTGRPELTAQSWSLRGRICERLGSTTKAIEAYSHNLADSTPLEQQREALGKLAELHLARGEVAEGLQKLTTFLGRATNSIAADFAMLQLAELHLKEQLAGNTATNHLDQALRWLDKLASGSPQSPLLGEALANRGWCYWLSNQPALSRAAFEEAARRLSPSDKLAVAQFKAGDAAFAMKDFAAARESYRAALRTMEAFPGAGAELSPQARYQLCRACLALNDMAGAEEVVRDMFKQQPFSTLTERSLLLTAQGLAQADQAGPASKLFTEFSTRFPDSELRPQAELAAARVLEQQEDWAGALARYESWRRTFTNHALLGDAEFNRALVLARLGQETNTYGMLTNFVVQYRTNPLAPAAEYWLGDYSFRLGDFSSSEKHFSLLYHYWPQSGLAPEACMMAGRAAIGRAGYAEAITHFTNLTANPNISPSLKSSALFGYGSVLRLQPSADPTNQIATLKLAVEVFTVIHRENPGTAEAAAAWVEIGNTYFQLGALDARFFDSALDAYHQVTNLPAASAASRGEAGVGRGLVAEKLAATGTAGRQFLLTAFNDYLDVLYDETGVPFWRKKAGLEAVRVGRELGEWAQVEQLCVRIQKLFPPLQAGLEKRRLEAAEKARAESSRTDSSK